MSTEDKHADIEKRTPAQQVTDYIEGRAWGGTESYRQSAIPGLLFTDGVFHVAVTCGAHWLIDVIASWQPSIRKRHGEQAGFQLWILEASKRVEGAWMVEAWTDTPPKHDSDSTGKLMAQQAIGHSDFPKELSPFRLWVEHGVLLLPAEH